MLKLVICDGTRYIGSITGKRREKRGSVSVGGSGIRVFNRGTGIYRLENWLKNYSGNGFRI